VSPRYGLTMAVALGVGIALGLVVILILERLDGGFRTGEQIERLTGRGVIGMIPSVSGSTLGGLRPARFVVEKSSTAYAEALRSTHTAMMLGSLDNPPKIIMTTSTLPGEGKSTFVCSLAALIARSNQDKRVVVIDGDLRRSSVMKALGVPETGGSIDELLSGTKTLEQVLGRDEPSGVYYIPARSNTPNSVEILSSRAMQNMLKTLSTQFDFILIDTPPLLAVSDARVTAELADYIVFLVRWEQTPREVAINALKLLRDKDKNVGVVLSQVNVHRHAKYGYGDYGYYYSRYRDYYTK
jgi:succinoglycan biosynthesis transport protein ExoP